jgi:lysophospholipase L1-like esterase
MTPPNPETSSPPLKLTWKHKLFLVLFGVFLMCAALEVALRLKLNVEVNRALDRNAAGSTGEFWATYEPEIGYRGNPKFPGYNSDGFHDQEIGPKGGTFRIMVLGDSVAVGGDSPEDTFPAYIEANLKNDAALAPVEVLNVSVRGYTNYQELLFLKKYGLHYQPDALLVEFCLNDLHKFLHSFRIENGKIVPGTYHFSTEAMKEASGLGKLARESYLLTWLTSKMAIVGAVLGSRLSGQPDFVHAVDIGLAWREEKWPAVEAQIAELQQIAQARGIPLLMTVAPLRLQYTTDYLQKDREFVLRPQRRVREICERRGIPFHDLYADLSADRFMDSLHFSKEGRQIAGERLAAFLVRNGVVPRKTAQ